MQKYLVVCNDEPICHQFGETEEEAIMEARTELNCAVMYQGLNREDVIGTSPHKWEAFKV